MGDGYISKSAQRSVNFYYQEHFGSKQKKYREWKLSYLKDLGFSIKGNYLRSPSHPYFTDLHPLLYKDNVKILTPDFLTRCTHPIFLLSLYLDDGSLILSYSYNKAKKTVYCHPSIVLYTLNLSRKENEMLASHLNSTFEVNFVVSGHPDGNGSLLKINKEREVRDFLKIINPYHHEIESMLYKMDLNENLRMKVDAIKEKYGDNVSIILSSSNRNRLYTQKELNLIIQLKSSGKTDQYIADQSGRSYWSIVYKIRDMRKSGLL